MEVTISALGDIKKFVPEKTDITLEAPIVLSELKIVVGIPKQRTIMYSVNGKVQKGDYEVADKDQVKFLMVVGAG